METLIVINHAPYGDWSGREALDMAFALAAFDQPVSLLFAGAGVNWLRPGQNGEAIFQKTLEKNLAAAPVFGVTEILAAEPDCHRFSLDTRALVAGARTVTCDTGFYRHYHHVIHL